MVDLKILLIEDEGKIAEFVIKGLSAAGYDVTHLDDGERGLAAVLEGAHDLVILDVMLPKLNGFELLHQARMAGMTTPVIILSAKVDLPEPDSPTMPIVSPALTATLAAFKACVS